MSLSPAQIIEISLAAQISKDAAADYVAGFDAEDETAMTALLLDWVKVKNKFSYLNGKIAGYVTETDKQRLAIRNYIRGMLGLPPLTDEFQTARENSSAGQIFESGNVETRFTF